MFFFSFLSFISARYCVLSTFVVNKLIHITAIKENMFLAATLVGWIKDLVCFSESWRYICRKSPILTYPTTHLHLYGVPVLDDSSRISPTPLARETGLHVLLYQR